MAHCMTLFRFFIFSMPFTLNGCGFYDWANTHMPVIGERCENWQCFTASGQEASREKQLQLRQQPAENPAPAAIPGGSTTGTPATATAPLAPPAGPEGATVYVPRQPSPDPGTMPLE